MGSLPEGFSAGHAEVLEPLHVYAWEAVGVTCGLDRHVQGFEERDFSNFRQGQKRRREKQTTEHIRRKFLHSWSRVCSHVFQTRVSEVTWQVDFGIKLFFLFHQILF